MDSVAILLITAILSCGLALDYPCEVHLVVNEHPYGDVPVCSRGYSCNMVGGSTVCSKVTDELCVNGCHNQGSCSDTKGYGLPPAAYNSACSEDGVHCIEKYEPVVFSEEPGNPIVILGCNANGYIFGNMLCSNNAKSRCSAYGDLVSPSLWDSGSKSCIAYTDHVCNDDDPGTTDTCNDSGDCLHQL